MIIWISGAESLPFHTASPKRQSTGDKWPKVWGVTAELYCFCCARKQNNTSSHQWLVVEWAVAGAVDCSNPTPFPIQRIAGGQTKLQLTVVDCNRHLDKRHDKNTEAIFTLNQLLSAQTTYHTAALLIFEKYSYKLGFSKNGAVGFYSLV